MVSVLEELEASLRALLHIMQDSGKGILRRENSKGWNHEVNISRRNGN